MRELRELRARIDEFRYNMPYRKRPYSSRGWGHPLHSLCSYQGKLKPAIAHWLIDMFTGNDDVVLDPLGGVGTIAFEACVQGRYGITNDLSPLAYAVATAKVSPPGANNVRMEVKRLEQFLVDYELTEDDLRAADFGLNAKVSDYFHEDTLHEILKARSYYLALKKLSPAQAFVKASVLHILHGNRPYALSRTSHPLTPFNPRGPFVYKNLIERLQNRMKRILDLPLPLGFKRGDSLNTDFRRLPRMFSRKIDTIITSPPFPGLRFD